MKTQTKNILVLTAKGHYIADLVDGGMRAGKKEGASVDFDKGTAQARSLTALAGESIATIDKRCTELIAARPRISAPTSRMKDGDQDWQSECMTCGETPTVHPTNLCGPCCFGEAATAGGNW